MTHAFQTEPGIGDQCPCCGDFIQEGHQCDLPSPAHTLAPWTIENEGDEHNVRLELKGDFGSKPIAHLYASFESDEYEYDTEEERLADRAEYQANARLIVAAPQLLAACEIAKESCELLPDSVKTDVLVGALEAAITQARGA